MVANVVSVEFIRISESSLGKRMVIYDISNKFPFISEDTDIPIQELHLNAINGVFVKAPLLF